MTLSIIVATDRDRGIGIDNRLPWRLPEDLAHFKRMTTGHPIIMGRKTFESIGRPLPGRRNIVITRNPAWQHEGVDCVSSISQALALVQLPSTEQADSNMSAETEAFVIGGAEIYRQALPLCTRLVVTEIDKVFDCDTFFPAIDGHVWEESARQAYHSDLNDCDYAFVEYVRIAE
ncbi:MAG: dihydrofolate reductase [Pseudomonadota bacterium]